MKNLVFLHGFLGNDLDWQGVIQSFQNRYHYYFSFFENTDFQIGYSMGGRIAMTNLTTPTVLIASHPGLETESQIAERIAFEEKWISILENETLELFLIKWYASPLFSGLKTIPKERFQLTKEEIKSTFLKFSLAKQPPFWNTLSELTLPLLYIVGEKDDKYREIGERLKRSNSRIQTAVVSDASHAVHLEKPKEVAELIEKFIGEYSYA